MRFGCAGLAALMTTAVLTLSGSPAAQDPQRPVFRAGTTAVTVNVSVKKGNTPVLGLTPADFRLFDNNVLQKVDDFSTDEVPIDSSLFLDTSGSTSGARDQMMGDLRAIVAMLRPVDRFRLLTIGHSVYQPIAWTPAGAHFEPELPPALSGISLIYDTLVMALLKRPEVDRRDLVLAFTDGVDVGSLVSAERLCEISARSEALLHVVVVDSIHAGKPQDAMAFSLPGQNPDHGLELLERAARTTGGEMHRGTFSYQDLVKTFAKVFDDFRLSYLLRYTPTGVAAGGWHQIKVETPKIRATIHARSGYFGTDEDR
jgi:VWFA-related protein